ncbi:MULTISPECIES: hypothetical protein [Bacillus]|uniref:Uncharacterized protein n=1 Tax=Bacillus altitudinis TaxID=293387 RepID=A0ABV1S7U2_BACAB|nr:MULTISPECIES: hypothetical protein [Bacillus]MCY7692188.1 hypothetical protein [Bacillus altitudinis]MDH3107516.1 hypothetical protein [Bacillus altitudinis]
MPQTVITFDEMTATVFQDQMQKLFQAAYEKGVEDGRNKYALKPVLTRKEAMEVLRCKETKMAELAARSDFPKNPMLGRNIPTKQLLEWIDLHTEWMKENTDYFKKGATA